MMRAMVTIISLGGSIVAPDAVDTDFVGRFIQTMRGHLEADAGRKVILIVGGGSPARVYQHAYRAIVPAASDEAADWIGIMATRLNAELVRACAGELCRDPVVTDPSAPIGFGGRVLVAAGWKPGFSTDFDAVWLAERFGAKTVINLSNIEKVYTDDPRKNPAAKPLDAIGWAEFRAMVGDAWEPGKNCPFDPVASRKASELGLKVICAAGRNLPNLEAILAGKAFSGTTIG
jgi:uridylate kinase